MTTPILVTGGTGTLGRLVLPLLHEAGRQVRVLTRGRREDSPGIEYARGDLTEKAGLTAAIAGVRTIVHLAGGPKGDDIAAGNLVQAAKAGGVGHIVFVSVISADVMPIRWFRMKHAAETAISSSGVPFTTLRAAQFHDLVFDLASKVSRLPVAPSPKVVRFQPVDARDVADRIAGLALLDAQGRVRDLAGPTVYSLDALLRSYLVARHKTRLMLPVPMVGKVGRAYRTAANLSLTDVDMGSRTWETFLSERVPVAR